MRGHNKMNEIAILSSIYDVKITNNLTSLKFLFLIKIRKRDLIAPICKLIQNFVFL